MHRPTAARRSLSLLYLLSLLAALARRPTDFLPVRSAYKVDRGRGGRLVVRFEIAPDYYLYRDQLGFEPATPGVTLGKPALPVGLDHEDEFFGTAGHLSRRRPRSASRSRSPAPSQDFEFT